MNIKNKCMLVYTLGDSLLGEISSALRAAAVRLEDQTIYVSFFFNDEITEEEKDNLEAEITGVYVDVPMEMFGETRYEKIVYPKALPSDVGIYVFSRDTFFPRQIQRSETLHCGLGIQIEVSFHQALLGRIPQHLRAARFELVEKNLALQFIFDGDPAEPERSLLTPAAQQIITDFPELQVKALYESWPSPKKMPPEGTYIFRRKE